MGNAEANSGGPEQLSLLASAIAGHDMQVVPAAPGELAWTDGKTIFVDANSNAREQLLAIAVQASLAAAGSLDLNIVRRLVGRPIASRRYLAMEAHRALAAMAHLLPRSILAVIDDAIASRTRTPAASLEAALGQTKIADPPAFFGTIRPRILLREMTPNASSSEAAPHDLNRQRGQFLAEFDENEDDDGGAIGDIFSAPGGAGVVGRLLQRLLGMVRQINGGGPPGGGASTHRSTRIREFGRTVYSTTMARAAEEVGDTIRTTTYPEWDVHRQCYRPDWCTVRERNAIPKEGGLAIVPGLHGLRRPLTRLGMGLERSHRQRQGDDIDIDAAVEARVEAMAGTTPDEAVYIDSLRRRRDLSVLVLLDVSGSAGLPAWNGQTVHEQQRAVAATLTATLHEIGDRVALYAFHSQGRSAVHLVPVKRFNEGFDMLVMRRLHGLVPGAYSRLGAAIRHGARVLQDGGGTSRQLLVVLSDGLAYDHGYEPDYGAADARHALAEARRQGVGCLCLSIGAGTDANALRRVFGSAAHATIPRPEQLSREIGPLFRSAIRSAEVRRRMAHRQYRLQHGGRIG